MLKDLELFGLKVDFKEQELRKVYKEFAKKYHPDNKETGDVEMFLKISQTYDRLINLSVNKFAINRKNIFEVIRR